MNTHVKRFFTGRARVTDAPKGDVEIMYAVFGIPDSSAPVGIDKPQVIDRGSFSAWIDRTDFREQPVQFFADHGDAAQLFGPPSPKATMKIGQATEIVETDEGAIARGRYNLNTSLGREMFSWLDDEWRASAQFSFSNPIEGMLTTTREGDDFEHVVEFPSVDEISQVGFGAQSKAHAISARTLVHALQERLPEEIDTVLASSEMREALAAKMLRDRGFALDVKRAAESALEPDEVDAFLAAAWKSSI